MIRVNFVYYAPCTFKFYLSVIMPTDRLVYNGFSSDGIVLCYKRGLAQLENVEMYVPEI